MIKKLFRPLLALLIAGVLIATYVLAAAAAKYSGPKQLTQQLSSDGKTLYNGVPAVVYRVDPNRPKNLVNIPPPLKLTTLQEKATASFAITYIANGGADKWSEPCYTFPEAAKPAFNAAASVWASLLRSSVPITIKACWATLDDPDILGYSGGGDSYRNFAGAPLPNIWYQSSLANALHGYNINPTKFDMHITYNSRFSWYYGTDGQTPSGQYDFMSIVLHEIAHGLNFSGTMKYSSGTGSWGADGYNIYDYFMKDNSGNQLVAFYTNPSTALGDALTSENLWFYGANAMSANGGTRVKMYAPSVWMGGSSYVHLDYDTFTGGPNRLMVYSFTDGVATHDPGPVTLGIFKDLGWPTDNNPVPVLSSLSPSSAITGDAALTLTVNGSNFVGGAVVRWDGANRVTSFVSGTQLTATIPATDLATAGIYPVSVFNPAPGGGTSTTSANFTVHNRTLSITSISPSSKSEGGAAFTLTVEGGNFVNGAVVQWGGSDRTTTFVSATQLTAAIPASDITRVGTYNVTVVNPAPYAATSDPLPFTVVIPSGAGGGGCTIGGQGGGDLLLLLALILPATYMVWLQRRRSGQDS